MSADAHRLQVDVAVIGAGPAGLACAAEIAPHARVALIDEKREVGGHGWARDVAAALGDAAQEDEDFSARLDPRAADLRRTILAAGGHLLTRARLVDVRPSLRVLMVRDDAPLVIDAKTLVLATGAQELFLPFPGWTLPGVFGLGGVMALMRGGASFAGRKAVVAGSGPLLTAAAAMLRARGAEVVAIAEQAGRPRAGSRRTSRIGRLAATLSGIAGTLGVRTLADSWPVRAEGGTAIEAVRLRRAGGGDEVVPCDLLACAFGLLPEDRLASYLDLERSSSGAVRVDAGQRTSRDGIFAAGDVCGPGGPEIAVLEGRIAGQGARGMPADADLVRRRDRLRSRIEPNELRAELRQLATEDTIVCRCEDATYGRVFATRGFREARLLESAGAGACQGRICGPALIFFGLGGDEIQRPPLCPVELGVLGRALEDF